MLTDEELDALARDVITETIAYLSRSGNPPFSAVRETDAGDPLIVYTAREKGAGAFVCEYEPLDLVKKIIRVCERYYDTIEVNTTDPNTGKEQKLSLAPILKDHWVGNMAANATVILISQFRSELLMTLDETLEDCYLIAAAYLASGVGKNLSMQSGKASSDATAAIEKAAERVSDKKRDKLRTIMKELSNLTVKPRLGRKPKSQVDRQRERALFIFEVEAAYRKLRLEAGTPPTKTSIARELGIGGDPKRGGQSALQVFNAKLKRLDNINYKKLAAKIESELNNNSK